MWKKQAESQPHQNQESNQLENKLGSIPIQGNQEFYSLLVMCEFANLKYCFSLVLLAQESYSKTSVFVGLFQQLTYGHHMAHWHFHTVDFGLY